VRRRMKETGHSGTVKQKMIGEENLKLTGK
jgi:hypothetical protein